MSSDRDAQTLGGAHIDLLALLPPLTGLPLRPMMLLFAVDAALRAAAEPLGPRASSCRHQRRLFRSGPSPKRWALRFFFSSSLTYRTVAFGRPISSCRSKDLGGGGDAEALGAGLLLIVVGLGHGQPKRSARVFFLASGSTTPKRSALVFLRSPSSTGAAWRRRRCCSFLLCGGGGGGLCRRGGRGCCSWAIPIEFGLLGAWLLRLFAGLCGAFRGCLLFLSSGTHIFDNLELLLAFCVSPLLCAGPQEKIVIFPYFHSISIETWYLCGLAHVGILSFFSPIAIPSPGTVPPYA